MNIREFLCLKNNKWRFIAKESLSCFRTNPIGHSPLRQPAAEIDLQAVTQFIKKKLILISNPSALQKSYLSIDSTFVLLFQLALRSISFTQSHFHRLIMEDDQYLKGDKLILRGLKFHGFHGVKPEERTLGQKFVIDVDAWMDLRPAGLSDDLSDTISYTAIYRIVKEVVEGEPKNLLESVAHKIACNTFTEFSQISAIRIKVGKPHVAVHGQLDYLGIEIFRKRMTDAQS